jgi:hypothetical protein
VQLYPKTIAAIFQIVAQYFPGTSIFWKIFIFHQFRFLWFFHVLDFRFVAFFFGPFCIVRVCGKQSKQFLVFESFFGDY